MTLITGIVLTIGVGTLAQNSEAIMSAFSGKTGAAAVDDSFTVRAGKVQSLDVLANDPGAAKAQEIRIVSQPACGSLSNSGRSLDYSDSGDCAGEQIIQYCIEVEGVCENASVRLNVIGAPAPKKPEPVLASTPPAPAAQPLPSSIAAATRAEPAPAAADDFRLAVLSALERPRGVTDDDDEEAASEFQPDPALPLADNKPPARSFKVARTLPEAAIPLPEAAPDDPSPDEYFEEVASLIASVPDTRPAVPLPPLRSAPLDGPALTSVKPVPTPDFAIDSAALIMLPSTQDRLGRRVGDASHTAALTDLRTDGTFVADVDDDQAADAPQTVQTAALSEAPLPGAAIPEPAAPAVAQPAAAICPVTVDLSVAAGAMLNAAIDASCRPGEIVTVEHAGIRFAVRTDASGKALVVFPAISADARVSVAFADGQAREARITVPDMERFMRVAVTWEGNADIDLHAFEFGANTGDRGHVWSGTPRSYRDARRFGGGYMTVLGLGAGSGPQAEIYTLPLYRSESGLVEMSLSLAGDTACNQDLAMRAVRTDTRHAATIRELRFKVTDCDRRSEPVFIANALEDLRVASRR